MIGNHGRSDANPNPSLMGRLKKVGNLKRCSSSISGHSDEDTGYLGLA